MISKFGKPLLALAMVFGLGTGIASAYDTCAPCASTVVVRRPVTVVRTTRRVECRSCDAQSSAMGRRRPSAVVVQHIAPVVYYEPVYREVVQEVVVSSPATCSTCPY